MSQRHKVQIFLLSQLIPLIKDKIACLTIPVEILSDNVGIPLTESTDNGLFRQLAMIHKQIFWAKLQKKSHFNLIFSEKRLQRYE